jgi:hypothetical protein
MQVENVEAVPQYRASRPKYGEMLEAIAKSEQWVRILLADIPAKTIPYKRSAVNQAAKQAGVRVRTRTDQTYIYVSRKAPVAVAA